LFVRAFLYGICTRFLLEDARKWIRPRRGFPPVMIPTPTDEKSIRQIKLVPSQAASAPSQVSSFHYCAVP